VTSSALSREVHKDQRRQSLKWMHQREAMGRKRLRVTENDRQLLGTWVRAGTTPQRVVRRARIVLLAADGCSGREIARRLVVSTHTVSLWCRRFESGGTAALMRDAPGRGRKVTVTTDAHVRVRALLATSPETGRWTVRAIARVIGISRASVHRVLKASESTLVSRDHREGRPDLSSPQPATDSIAECDVRAVISETNRDRQHSYDRSARGIPIASATPTP